MTTTKMTVKGQVLIPSDIRKSFHLQKGSRLSVRREGERIIMEVMTAGYFEKMAGVLGTEGRLTRALLAERRKEKARERR